MQFAIALVLVLSGLCNVEAGAGKARVSPVSKVMEILENMKKSLTVDTKEAAKAYIDYASWCHDNQRDYKLKVQQDKETLSGLDATISQAKGQIVTSKDKISSLAEEIMGEQHEINEATILRKQQNDEFRVNEKEIMDTLDTIERAQNVLRRNLEATKNATTINLLQTKGNNAQFQQIAEVLSRLLDASAVSVDDRKRLIGFAQTGLHNAEDDEEQLGAPKATSYNTQSESIVDVLEDLREKAQNELRELRKQEVAQQFAYDTRKGSLQDEIAFENQQLDETRGLKAGYEETEASAEGNHRLTYNDKVLTEETLAKLLAGCDTAKHDYDVSSKSRAEELKAIKSAIDFLKGNVEGAEKRVYKDNALEAPPLPESFLEVGSVKEHANFANQFAGSDIVDTLRDVAKKGESTQLAQLASKVSAVLRLGGDDPFAKVKKMVSEMINKLLDEASSEAQHKEWCDKEQAETANKKDDLSSSVDRLSAAIDKAKAAKAKLLDEAAKNNKMLAKIAEETKKMDKVRQQEHLTYAKTKADLEVGLSGVRYALKVLKQYYGSDQSGASLVQELPTLHLKHEKDQGAATNIIGLLEVIESDFGQSLEETETAEQDAQNDYEKTSQQNKLETMSLEEEVRFKFKAADKVEKKLNEKSSDREAAAEELDAVSEYASGVNEKCNVKPESFEERSRRREEEIEGLNEALKNLGGEEGEFLQTRKAGFLQKK